MPGTFTVRPIEARLTHDTDIIGRMNPYCAVVIGNNRVNGQVCKHGGKHPHWNDSITVPVTNESKVVIELMDKDKISQDDYIGSLVLDLRDVQALGKVSRWYPLSYKDQCAGEILLEAVLQPEALVGQYPQQAGIVGPSQYSQGQQAYGQSQQYQQGILASQPQLIPGGITTTIQSPQVITKKEIFQTTTTTTQPGEVVREVLVNEPARYFWTEELFSGLTEQERLFEQQRLHKLGEQEWLQEQQRLLAMSEPDRIYHQKQIYNAYTRQGGLQSGFQGGLLTGKSRWYGLEHLFHGLNEKERLFEQERWNRLSEQEWLQEQKRLSALNEQDRLLQQRRLYNDYLQNQGFSTYKKTIEIVEEATRTGGGQSLSSNIHYPSSNF